MGGRDNLIGIILVGFCLVMIGALIWDLGSGNDLTYNGPAWLPGILMIVFLGVSVYGIYQGLFKNRGSNRWPNPEAGRKSLWDRLRGK